MTTQTIGLIGTFTLAAISLIAYTVLAALGVDTSGLIQIVGGLGIAGVVQGAAILRTPS